LLERGGNGILKMTVDQAITLKMAKAAQLRVEPENVEKMMSSINDILDFCALVGDLDCEGVPDFMWRMKKLPSRRPDVPADWPDRELFESAAPVFDGEFFKTPRIIAEG
jgi:aspartyl-tRNA(Asn)/glutamyl-tRNA(Gln) amidotransferase subunit C